MNQITFGKDRRLSERSDFEDVFKSGRRLSRPYFKMFVCQNGRPQSRLGVNVAKRLGNAVFRNSVKRIIREWFRMNCSGFSNPVDMVIVFRAETGGFSPELLRKELDAARVRGDL